MGDGCGRYAPGDERVYQPMGATPDWSRLRAQARRCSPAGAAGSGGAVEEQVPPHTSVNLTGIEGNRKSPCG